MYKSKKSTIFIKNHRVIGNNLLKNCLLTLWHHLFGKINPSMMAIQQGFKVVLENDPNRMPHRSELFCLPVLAALVISRKL